MNYGKSLSSYPLVPARVLLGALLLVCGVMLLFWYAVASQAVSFIVSSGLIIVVIAFCAKSYGPVSVPVIVFSAAFLPALSFLWASINGAQYINYHNQWLQDDRGLVNEVVLLAAVSAVFAYATLVLVRKNTAKKSIFCRYGQVLNNKLYFLVVLVSGFFFWLTDPSFKTILTAQYSVLLEERFENTQYAGGLAMVLWVLAFGTYSARAAQVRMAGVAYGAPNWIDRFFVLVTWLAVLWLALHARRSELIGIGVVLLLAYGESKGQKKAIIVALSFVFVLVFIGAARSYTVFEYFSGSVIAGGRQDIASLPGGMSNIFMTYLDTMDYFKGNALLYGETFINYLTQLAPTNLYKYLNVETVPYFFETVFSEYSYNGGTYLGAVFYGNFGVSGAMIYGVFVGIYAITVQSLLLKKNLIIKAIGLYMIALVFRGFWYELITIIKPVIVVMAPAGLLLAVAKAQTARLSRGSI